MSDLVTELTLLREFFRCEAVMFAAGLSKPPESIDPIWSLANLELESVTLALVDPTESAVVDKCARWMRWAAGAIRKDAK